jgi:hypothetical protein
MRKLSEIKGEEALDVLAEILVPITTIANDAEVRDGFETNVAKCVSIALKKYKDEIFDILSAIDGKEKDEFIESVDLLTLPVMIVEVMNEPMVQELFQ